MCVISRSLSVADNWIDEDAQMELMCETQNSLFFTECTGVRVNIPDPLDPYSNTTRCVIRWVCPSGGVS